MLGALVLDQLGVFGLTARPIDGAKIAGVAALVLGVALLRR